MSENATAATVRTDTASIGKTEKGTTGRKREGMKEGQSTGSSMEENQRLLLIDMVKYRLEHKVSFSQCMILLRNFYAYGCI